MRWIAALLLPLALAACNTPRPHPLVVPDPFQTPLPFAQDRQPSELLTSITETASVVLDPIEGLEGEFGEAVRGDIAAAAQDADIPLTNEMNAHSADRLRGAFSARINRGVGMDGFIAWTFETAEGEVIDTFEVSAPLRAYEDWDRELFSLENEAWRQAIAAETADRLATAVDSRPMTAARLAGMPSAGGTAGPPVLIPAITGAPGDGNISLTRAVRALLLNAEVNVVDPDNPPADFVAEGSYTLQGTVSLGEVLPDGGQPIAIAWDLYDSEGAHLGNVAQQNLIEPGSLDGPWGEIAVFAGMGAVEGILELLAAVPDESA